MRVFKRGKVYYADWYENGRKGKRIRKRLGNITHKKALEIAKTLEARCVMEACGIRDNDCPVADLHKSYLANAEQRLRPKAFRRVGNCLDNILGYLAVETVSQITIDRVTEYRAWRRQQKCKRAKERTPTPRTINMEVGALSTMFNYGVKHGKIASNPIKGLAPLPHETKFKDRRPLTTEEVLAILSAATEHYRPIWLALLSTGMRLSELASLRFCDIDWETHEIIVRGNRAKNHHERRIPVESAAVWSDLVHRRDTAELRQPGEGTTAKITEQIAARFTRDHVFVTEANTPLGNNVRPRFYETCRRAGVDVGGLEDGQGNAIDLHALRGTFATHAAQNGADIAALGEVTGHKDISVLLRHYLKAMQHTKRQAVSALPWSGKSAKPGATVAIDTAKEAV